MLLLPLFNLTTQKSGIIRRRRNHQGARPPAPLRRRWRAKGSGCDIRRKTRLVISRGLRNKWSTSASRPSCRRFSPGCIPLFWFKSCGFTRLRFQEEGSAAKNVSWMTWVGPVCVQVWLSQSTHSVLACFTCCSLSYRFSHNLCSLRKQSHFPVHSSFPLHHTEQECHPWLCCLSCPPVLLKS